MPLTKKIELLSPARDALAGIEAIRHGADAVYIGGPKFGARSAAGNSFEEIGRLVNFAHTFGAKVYATLNTILFDSEIAEAEETACRLIDLGTDALLIQDAAYLEMNLPKAVFHASTQCDNRTPEKIARLYDEGFSTTVLARELSINEISEIHKKCPEMRLEAFVHGALCVSLSGRCYASQHCFGRSANRGDCAQFCRLPFDLETSEGEKLLSQKHLLSLRDLNRTDYLEEMLDAGVSSLKIEGRLKDTEYVKNITWWYRKKLDEIFSRRKEYRRASIGEAAATFTPKPEKSFNRGFTDYFLHGRTPRMACPATPKNIGQPVGEVRGLGEKYIVVSGSKIFSNGDGLCFFTDSGTLRGFRVNRAEGNKLFPHVMPQGLKVHTHLYRNHDEAFEQKLKKPTATRTIKVFMTLDSSEEGYVLKAEDQLSRKAEANIDYPHENARTPQRDNIVAQLSKLGETGFRLGKAEINFEGRFIPSSLVAAARREVIDKLSKADSPREKDLRRTPKKADMPKIINYTDNVSNSLARKYFKDRGAEKIEPAWEIEEPKGKPIMTCRYCVRHELGICLKEKGSPRGDLFLRLADGKRYPLEFDCQNCYMKVYAEE